MKQQEYKKDDVFTYAILVYAFFFLVIRIFLGNQWSVSFIPFPLAVIMALLFIVFSLEPINYQLYSGLLFVTSKLYGLDKNNRKMVYLCFSFGLFFIFLLFRNQNYFLGDIALLRKLVSDGYQIDAQGTFGIYLQSLLFKYGREWFDLKVADTWAFSSAVFGSIFVYALLRFSEDATEIIENRIIFILLILSVSTSQLFFGYMEHYPGAYLFLFLAFMSSYYFLSRGTDIFYPALCFGCVVTFSVGYGFSTLGLILLVYFQLRKSNNFMTGCGVIVRTAVAYLLPIVTTYTVLYLFYNINPVQVGSKSHIILYPEQLFYLLSDDLALCSKEHLIDFANLILHSAPFGLFFFSPLIIIGWNKVKDRKKILVYYGMSSFLPLIILFNIRSLIGMQRDWDLFSQYVLPFLFLLFFMYEEIFNLERTRKWVLPMLIIQIINLFSWILYNHCQSIDLTVPPHLLKISFIY